MSSFTTYHLWVRSEYLAKYSMYYILLILKIHLMRTVLGYLNELQFLKFNKFAEIIVVICKYKYIADLERSRQIVVVKVLWYDKIPKSQRSFLIPTDLSGIQIPYRQKVR